MAIQRPHQRRRPDRHRRPHRLCGTDVRRIATTGMDPHHHPHEPGVDFNSTTKNFSFGATAKITFTTTELAIRVKFALENEGNNQYKNVMDGDITIKHVSNGGESVFRINFTSGTTDTRLKASGKRSTLPNTSSSPISWPHSGSICRRSPPAGPGAEERLAHV